MFHCLYSSQKGEIGQNVAHMGETRNSYGILVKKLQGRKPIGIGGRVILEWILMNTSYSADCDRIQCWTFVIVKYVEVT
jgi:hypothetical protein